VISNEQNPRDVARWFAERMDPCAWSSSTLVLLFQQARDGATLESMEHFLEINAATRRSPSLGVSALGGV